MACECYDKAKEQNLQYFAIRYWGECYGGKDINALESLKKRGGIASSNCANAEFKDCVDSNADGECAGKEFAEYMYKMDSNFESKLLFFLILSVSNCQLIIFVYL